METLNPETNKPDPTGSKMLLGWREVKEEEEEEESMQLQSVFEEVLSTATQEAIEFPYIP